MKIKSDRKLINLVILALFLMVTALSGTTPAMAEPAALPAAAPSAQDSVQITFGMDMHQRTDRFTQFLTCVANDDVIPDVVAQGGDFNNVSTSGKTYDSSDIDPIVEAVFSDVDKIYTQGNNDHPDLIGKGNFVKTGKVYEKDSYIIYPINEIDFPLKQHTFYNGTPAEKEATANETIENLKTFLEDQKDTGAGKVIFILSHVPLHQARNDNPYGYAMALMLNNVIDNDLDVVFLWGHNHTQDATQNYKNRNEQVTFNDNGTGRTLNIKFIYAAAGYINGSSTNTSVIDSGTVATVTDTEIILTRYRRDNCNKTETLTATRYSSQSTDLTGVSISGTPKVGQTLTSALIPAGASATYQWQSAAALGGPFATITGATDSTYTLAAGDLERYIRVKATGPGSNPIIVTSNVLGPVTATTSTIYRLTDKLEAGKKYLIVSQQIADPGYILAHDNKTGEDTHKSVPVTINADTAGNYIEASPALANGVWTAVSKTSGFQLKNGDYYIQASTSDSKIFIQKEEYSQHWNYNTSSGSSTGVNELWMKGTENHILHFSTSGAPGTNVFYSARTEKQHSGAPNPIDADKLAYIFVEEEGAVQPTEITSVAIADIDAPVALVDPDTTASVAATPPAGIASSTAAVSWDPAHASFAYSTVYTASVTLTAAQGYAFTNTTSATVNGQTATSVTLNGDGTLTVTFTFSETEDAPSNTHAIALKAGWNLVSFNLIPNDDNSIEVILADIFDDVLLVYAWDATEAGSWMRYAPLAGFGNSLAALDNTMGFWINMKKDATLTITGTQPTGTDITLYEGWNLIGYPVQNADAIPDALTAIDNKYDLILAYKAFDTEDPWKLYDPDAPNYANDLATMAPGWGYWIHITETTAFDWSLPY